MEHFEFAFDDRFQPLLRTFGVGPDTAEVRLTDDDRFVARFGRLRISTPLSNVAGTRITGPYRWYRAIGARSSLAGRRRGRGHRVAVGRTLRRMSDAALADHAGDLRDLRALIRRGRVLVVTGAGISTDSGIPDYRGPDGAARHHAPMTFERFVGSSDERQRYWARSHIGWSRIAAARPNPSHHALTAMELQGRTTGIVTQNVDGLHSAAGTREVIDLHGRLDAVVCLGCGDRRPRLEVRLRLDVLNPGFTAAAAAAPATDRPDGDVVLDEDAVAAFRTVDCRRCGGVLKPDVVFFGEHVPRERFQRSLALLDRSSALLVLGSSLTVGSGFRFVTAARRRGLPVAIVNRGVTRGDRYADVKVDAGLADILPGLAAAAVTPVNA